MTSTQTHMQEQLQRKHEELQQLIVQQQDELRRVSEQLLMARYGLVPSIVLPYNPINRDQIRTPAHAANASSTVVSSHTPALMNHPQGNLSLAIAHDESHLHHHHANNSDLLSYMDLSASHETSNLDQDLAAPPTHLQPISHEQRQSQPSPASQSNLHPESNAVQIHSVSRQSSAHSHHTDDDASSILRQESRPIANIGEVETEMPDESDRNELALMSYHIAEESPSGFFSTTNL